MLGLVLLNLLSPGVQSSQGRVLVDSPHGQFAFDVALVKDYGLSKIKGRVTNNTTKDWLKLEFGIAYYDSSGRAIETFADKWVFFDLKKGASQELGSGMGETILAKDLTQREVSISRFEIKFLDGTFPAIYTFVLLKRLHPKTGQSEFAESSELTLSDESISFSFSIAKGQVAFVLENKTDEPIEIDWNKAAYVDVSGRSHKVMHSGVKYIEREKPMAPTTVPPSAKLDEILFPSDYVEYSEVFGHWRELPLFPDGDEAKTYEGKTFSVFLPLKFKGSEKNYSFRFKVSAVQL